MLANNNGPSNVGAGSVSGGAKVPPLIREFVQSLDDKEWQSALFGLLQSQVKDYLFNSLPLPPFFSLSADSFLILI